MTGSFRQEDGKIVVKNYDIDISLLDRQVKDMITRQNKESLDQVNNQLITWQLKRTRTQSELRILQARLAELQANPVLQNYIQATADLVANMIQTPNRQAYLEEYLIKTRRYVNMDICCLQPASVDNCPECGGELVEPVAKDQNTHCSRCFLEVASYYTEVSNNDTEIVTKSGYDDRENFLKALHCYQGKQTCSLPASLEQDLDNYFRSYFIPVGSHFRSLPSDEWGRKPGTSRSMMLAALQKIGMNDQYDNLQLICSRYWGWVLPDVSMLESVVMEDYDNTQRVYESLTKDRQSSINTQIRLRFHLMARGHKCAINDEFKLVSSAESVEKQEELLRVMAARTGLRYHPIV